MDLCTGVFERRNDKPLVMLVKRTPPEHEADCGPWDAF